MKLLLLPVVLTGGSTLLLALTIALSLLLAALALAFILLLTPSDS